MSNNDNETIRKLKDVISKFRTDLIKIAGFVLGANKLSSDDRNALAESPDATQAIQNFFSLSKYYFIQLTYENTKLNISIDINIYKFQGSIIYLAYKKQDFNVERIANSANYSLDVNSMFGKLNGNDNTFFMKFISDQYVPYLYRISNANNDSTQEEELKKLQECANKIISSFNNSDLYNSLPKVNLTVPEWVDTMFKSNPQADSTDLEAQLDKNLNLKTECEMVFRQWDSDIDKFKLLLEDPNYTDLNSEINMLKDRQKILYELDNKMAKPEFKAFSKLYCAAIDRNNKFRQFDNNFKNCKKEVQILHSHQTTLEQILIDRSQGDLDKLFKFTDALYSEFFGFFEKRKEQKNFFKLRQYQALRDISRDLAGRFVEVFAKMDIFAEKEGDFNLHFFKRRLECITNYKDLLQSKITNEIVTYNQSDLQSIIDISKEELAHDTLVNRIETICRYRHVAKKVLVLFPSFKNQLQMHLERINETRGAKIDIITTEKISEISEANLRLSESLQGLKVQDLMELKTEEQEELLGRLSLQEADIYSRFSEITALFNEHTTKDQVMMKHYSVLTKVLDVDNDAIFQVERRLVGWLRTRFNALKKANKMEKVQREKQYLGALKDCMPLTADCAIKNRMKNSCEELLNDLGVQKCFKKRNKEEWEAFKREIEVFRTQFEYSDSITKWKDSLNIDLVKVNKTPLITVSNGEIKSNFDNSWNIALKEFYTFKKVVEHHNDGSINISATKSKEDDGKTAKISKSLLENFNKTFKIIKGLSDLNIILVECLKTFHYQSRAIDEFKEISQLMQNHRNKVFRIINEQLMNDFWTDGVKDTIMRLSNIIHEFAENTSKIIANNKQIFSLMDKLASEEDESTIKETFNEIKTMVKKSFQSDYQDFYSQIEMLDRKIESLFSEKLKTLVKKFIQTMSNQDENQQEKKGMLLEGNTTHQLGLKNGLVVVEPPICESKRYQLNKLHEQIRVVCDYTNLRSEVFEWQDGDTGQNAGIQNCNREDVQNTQMCMWGHFEAAEKFLLQFDQFKQVLGKNRELVDELMSTGRHQELFDRLRGSLNALASLPIVKHQGPIMINITKFVKEMRKKITSFQNEILTKFGRGLNLQIKQLLEESREHRLKIEESQVEYKSNSINAFVSMRTSMHTFLADFEEKANYQSSEYLLLTKQHWSDEDDNRDYSALLVGELEMFQALMNCVDHDYINHLEIFKATLNREQSDLLDRRKYLKSKFDEVRLNKKRSPTEAANSIEDIEKKYAKILEEMKVTAEVLKELEISQQNPDIFKQELQEMQDYKFIITELKEILEKFGVVKETFLVEANFQDIIDNKIVDFRDRIMQIIKKKHKLSTESIVDEINDSIEVLTKLKMFSLQAREEDWKDLIKRIGKKSIRGHPKVLDILNINFKDHSNVKKLDELTRQIQQVGSLISDIKNIEKRWKALEFEFREQERTPLIQRQEEVFDFIEEDLNNLKAMKDADQQVEVQDRVQLLDYQLNSLQVILTRNMDIQKLWIQLYGVFLSPDDFLRKNLYKESDSFLRINQEFTSRMRKLFEKKLVIEAVNILEEKDLAIQIKKLQEIKKALLSQLEKQRAEFPRFYFIGDDDLITLLGQSKKFRVVNDNIRKLFMGIYSLQQSTDMTAITTMISAEGEELPFSTPVIKEKRMLTHQIKDLEKQMSITLFNSVKDNFETVASQTDQLEFSKLIAKVPLQVLIILINIKMFRDIEDQLSKGQGGAKLKPIVQKAMDFVQHLATNINKVSVFERKNYEQLITDMVHKKDLLSMLKDIDIQSLNDFEQLMNLRQYQDSTSTISNIKIKICQMEVDQGYEQLGIGERLVQTKLTDRCFLTLSHSLSLKMGGKPFGPAGTGKTESVKALGVAHGIPVFVFCCDENFNLAAMARIFSGLCELGAWGCFDEFNRLDPGSLSAVSAQIITIQHGLQDERERIDLEGRQVNINKSVGIFITMNPKYIGRSKLPENLKNLFRGVAMVKPDTMSIGEVKMFTQGFVGAKELANKVVTLFDLCDKTLSKQKHYDFGLRALKSVLATCGELKRNYGDDPESELLLKALQATIAPKLVQADKDKQDSILANLFANIKLEKDMKVQQIIEESQEALGIIKNQPQTTRVDQVVQLLNQMNGLIMVGPAGSGKTTVIELYKEYLHKVGQAVSEIRMNPKSLSKHEFQGSFDENTNSMEDGLFTKHIRETLQEIDDIKDRKDGQEKIFLFVLDGDVDPVWAENLNSVLDDSKLFTLPSGERLNMPMNIKFIMEVDSLEYATQATVSRCGMVYVQQEDVTPQMLVHGLVKAYNANPFKIEFESIQRAILENVLVGEYCLQDRIKKKIMEYHKMKIMSSPDQSSVQDLFSLINSKVGQLISMESKIIDESLLKDRVLMIIIESLCQTFTNAIEINSRPEIAEFIKNSVMKTLKINLNMDKMYDCYQDIEQGKWVDLAQTLTEMRLEEDQITRNDVVIPTKDTEMMQRQIHYLLLSKRVILMCGPPGTGKTMSIMNQLENSPTYYVVFINFSSSYDIKLFKKTLKYYCELTPTNQGQKLSPKDSKKTLVIFCDEINLPSTDNYGTIFVLQFIRDILEHGQQWDFDLKARVYLQNVLIVGACNPPTDKGRNPIPPRLLKHCCVFQVDFPSQDSFLRIQGTFNRLICNNIFKSPDEYLLLTKLQVDFQMECRTKYNTDMENHYIQSPRELTRWKLAIYAGITDGKIQHPEDLLRLTCHEALRLWQDRMTHASHKRDVEKILMNLFTKYFGKKQDLDKTLQKPILQTSLINGKYLSYKYEDLRREFSEKMEVFKQNKEFEGDIDVQFQDEALEHIVRIDRVLKVPMGHLLLVGKCGTGKTLLTKFVCKRQNYTVVQINPGPKYSIEDFDADLKKFMKEAAGLNSKAEEQVDKNVIFILEESSLADVAFVERMNSLLASGDIPGLFEGEDQKQLVTSQKKMQNFHDKDDQVYDQIIRKVQRYLHIVIMMNPDNSGFTSRTASSPAIFNRCVIDWFGQWDTSTYTFITNARLKFVDVNAKADFAECSDVQEKRSFLTKICIKVFEQVHSLNQWLKDKNKHFNFLSSADYLDFLAQFQSIQNMRSEEGEKKISHFKVGLQKLEQINSEIQQKMKALHIQKKELEDKNEILDVEYQKQMQLMVEINDRTVKLEKENQELQLKNEILNQTLGHVQKNLESAQHELESSREKITKEIKNHVAEVKTQKKGANPDFLEVTTHFSSLLFKQSQKNEEDAKKDFIKNSMSLTNYLEKFNDEDSSKEGLSEKEIDKLASKYSVEQVSTFNRRSQAIAAMADWIRCAINMMVAKKSVKPLKEKNTKLIEELEVKKATLEDNKRNLHKLTDVKAKCDKDIKKLSEEADQLKEQIKRASGLVDKCNAIYEGLSSERSRWQQSVDRNNQLNNKVVGDCILAAAFLTQQGFQDKKIRDWLTDGIQNILKQFKLNQNELSNDMTVNLTTAEDKQFFKRINLPDDVLMVENVTVLKNFTRWPLIIDPSNQLANHLDTLIQEGGHSSNKKRSNLIKVKSSDKNLYSKLRNAVKHGQKIVIEDAEKLDPILYPLLKREVNISNEMKAEYIEFAGFKEIFNKNLQLYLTTKDSFCNWLPNICANVCFVNFTTTINYLHYFVKEKLFAAERPQENKLNKTLLVEQQKIESEIQTNEQKLLEVLNNNDNILEDDEVTKELDKLKRKSQELKHKEDSQAGQFAHIQEVLGQQDSIVEKIVQVYFFVSSLTEVSQLQQFNTNVFNGIFNDALSSYTNSSLEAIASKDQDKRNQAILKQFILKMQMYVSPALMHENKQILELKLLSLVLEPKQIVVLEKLLQEELPRKEINWSPRVQEQYSSDQLAMQAALGDLEQFNELLATSENQIISFAKEESPESINCPILKEEFKADETMRILLTCLTTRILRRDRFSNCLEMLKAHSGSDILIAPENVLSSALEAVRNPKEEQVCCLTTPGQDITDQLMQVAKNVKGVKVSTVSLGKSQNREQANKRIAEAQKKGEQVFLFNGHLDIEQLSNLPTVLSNINNLNPQFRLVLVCEITSTLPLPVLKNNHKVLFEKSIGIKESLNRAWKSVLSFELMQSLGISDLRLPLVFSYIHTVILERNRFRPQGWAEEQEFSDNDLLTIIKSQFEQSTYLKNDEPKLIDSMRQLMFNSVQGSKIENSCDLLILEYLLNDQLGFNSIDKVMEAQQARLPQAKIKSLSSHKEVVDLINTLPIIMNPEQIDLNNNVERVLNEKLTEITINTQSTIKKLEAKELAVDLSSQTADKDDTHEINTRIDQILSQIDLQISTGQEFVDNEFIQEYITSEVKVAKSLIAMVKTDLLLTKNFLKDKKGFNSRVNYILDCLKNNIVPKEWLAFGNVKQPSLKSWLISIEDILKQIKNVCQYSKISNLNLGLLFYPDRFITYSRQQAAKHQNLTLYQICNVIDNTNAKIDYKLENVTFEFSKLDKGHIILDDLPQNVQSGAQIKYELEGKFKELDNQACVPFYLDKYRDQLIGYVQIKSSEKDKKLQTKKGVALVARNI